VRPSVLIGGRVGASDFCRSLRVVGGFPACARLNRDLAEKLGV